jgi:hypothetical protein
VTRWVAPLLMTALLSAPPAPVAAQTVYRCGPDGREYSQQPCKDGRAVDVADPRSAAQQREGERVARDQKRLAERLEAQRRQREAAATPQGAAALRVPRVPEAAPAASSARKSKGQHRAKDAETTSTTARVPREPKQKAGR